jgi:hypothetical protein
MINVQLRRCFFLKVADPPEFPVLTRCGRWRMGGYLELKTIETFPHKSRLKLYGTAFQGTTLIYLREMHELRSTIT